MRQNNAITNFSIKRVIIKGTLLFLLINFIFVPLAPLPVLGRISAYNYIFPGRVRLPYGENSDQAYNLSTYNLEAMFASHELNAGKKPIDEFRVLLIGDSSVWGYLLKSEDTLSANLNAAGIKLNDGRLVRAYNLGYPTLSLAKDLLILNYAIRYQPDAIIWLITMESMPASKQLDSPIVQNNPDAVQNLIANFQLNLNPSDPRFVKRNFLQSTLIGERRDLADILRLQLYGVMWASTGIDQYYPVNYEPPQENLDPDEALHDLEPPNLNPNDLSIDILMAGYKLAGELPILFVNEPIYISHGENSDIRYNFFYPRWAYDQFRQLFAETCQNQSWLCLDEWNSIPPDQFTNSAIHMTPYGSQLLSTKLAEVILSLPNP
jgi:hypothetical protein